jgi:hypothetical protein
MDGEDSCMHQLHLNYVENWVSVIMRSLDAWCPKVSRRSQDALMTVLAPLILLFGETFAQPAAIV